MPILKKRSTKIIEPQSSQPQRKPDQPIPTLPPIPKIAIPGPLRPPSTQIRKTHRRSRSLTALVIASSSDGQPWRSHETWLALHRPAPNPSLVLTLPSARDAGGWRQRGGGGGFFGGDSLRERIGRSVSNTETRTVSSRSGETVVSSEEPQAEAKPFFNERPTEGGDNISNWKPGTATRLYRLKSQRYISPSPVPIPIHRNDLPPTPETPYGDISTSEDSYSHSPKRTNSTSTQSSDIPQTPNSLFDELLPPLLPSPIPRSTSQTSLKQANQTPWGRRPSTPYTDSAANTSGSLTPPVTPSRLRDRDTSTSTEPEPVTPPKLPQPSYRPLDSTKKGSVDRWIASMGVTLSVPRPNVPPKHPGRNRDMSDVRETQGGWKGMRKEMSTVERVGRQEVGRGGWV